MVSDGVGMDLVGVGRGIGGMVAGMLVDGAECKDD